MFEFADIWVFLLAPLPWLIFKKLPEARKNSSAVVVPFYQQFTLEKNITTNKPWLMISLLTIIWLLLLCAAARPQWVGEAQLQQNHSRDLLLAVDISDSMSQEDMLIDNNAITRLQAVKAIAGEFIERRSGDRLGLILFGSQAYLQTPLTFDRETVNQFLQETQLGFAGAKTAIGDAIGLSVKRLQQTSENSELSQVLILLTDGANTSGEVEPLQAAKLAQQTGVKIYTIGIGADEMVMRGLFGNRLINPSASLDEETLQNIANETGGQYFRARNTEELDKIYDLLDQLEPVEQQGQWLRPIKSLFIWPLAFALFLNALLVFFHLIPSFSLLLIKIPTKLSRKNREEAVK